jgi:predicted NAD/FAD-binding protein
MNRARVAVVGAGISGLTAAYLLRHTHDVTLYEAEDRLGGHSHTHDVAVAAGRRLGVDSGFIVHNDRTYPLLQRLFRELGVAVRPTEMSMGIACRGCGLEYAGGRGVAGILAQRRRLADPRFVRMLVEITRFQRLARRAVDDPATATETFGEFLERHRFGRYFIDHYAIPVVSCVWSCGATVALRYPAVYLFAFLDNHGFLSLGDAPQWYTVVGGSRTYVDRIATHLDDVRRGLPVAQVERTDDAVVVTDAGGRRESFDQVVLAVHGDDVLPLLADPTLDEKEVFSCFEYTSNRTVLHRDDRRLPVTPAARSSWNLNLDDCGARPDRPQVTYWMNRLHGYDEASPLLVTLNAEPDDEPRGVISEATYRHPVYTPASVAAAGRLPGLRTARTAYAGAYHGWGFHEDGCRSGVAAAQTLGGGW